MKRLRGFSLIELLVSIGIIALLVTVVAAALGPARREGRDKARIATVSSLGRYLLAGSCYVPQGGAGDYDFETLYQEIAAANPAVRQFLPAAPKDPSLGTGAASGYRYLYAADGHCAIYANLEHPGAALTNEAVTAPAAGASGTFRGAPGPNGTDRWYQVGR